MTIKFSTSSGRFGWKPAAWLRVWGPDAAAFLQGQFSNDLRTLAGAGSGAVYGLWLTVKGKVLADSFVLRSDGAEEFWVGSYFSPAPVIRERIESYLIADEVEIEDCTAEVAAVSVLGAPTPAEGGLAGPAGPWVFRGRRERAGSFEVVYRVAEAVEAELAELSPGAELTIEEVRRRRIAAGIPAVPEDLGPADLPQEAGLEEDAVSFSKGCYLGQEVMARLKSMGQVRRRLIRVAGRESEAPLTPLPLFAAGRVAGELRSAVSDGAGGWIGLAMVSRAAVTLVDELAVGTEGGPAVRLMESP